MNYLCAVLAFLEWGLFKLIKVLLFTCWYFTLNLWQDSGKYKKSGITGKIALSENQPQVRHFRYFLFWFGRKLPFYALSSPICMRRQKSTNPIRQFWHCCSWQICGKAQKYYRCQYAADDNYVKVPWWCKTIFFSAVNILGHVAEVYRYRYSSSWASGNKILLTKGKQILFSEILKVLLVLIKMNPAEIRFIRKTIYEREVQRF